MTKNKTNKRPEIGFEIVNDLPKRSYTKKSIYDELLEKFKDSGESSFKLITDIDANYLRTSIVKRMEVTGMSKEFTASVINGAVYLIKK